VQYSRSLLGGQVSNGGLKVLSGLGLINPINKGMWITASYYYKFDVVIFNNLSYICNTSGVSKIDPSRATSIWSIFPIETLSPAPEIESSNLKGDKGDPGDQGIQGIKGDTGAQGGPGIQGSIGLQGSQGIQGIAGIQGIQGIQGLQSIQGVKGDTGLQGVKGDTGLQGSVGITGPQGPQGIKGETGLQGIQGIQGDSGPQLSYIISKTDLGAHRAVTALGEYAGVKSAVGFTIQAVNIDESVAIMTSGELSGFSGLAPGEPIFLQPNGLYSHLAPMTGLSQVLGHAKSLTTIIIQIHSPIFLGN
jgi:hypothetical protein